VDRDVDVAPRRLRLGAFLGAVVLVAAACGSGNGGGTGASSSASASTGASGSASASASASTDTGGSASASASAGASGSPGASGQSAFQPPQNNVELTLWNAFTGPDGNYFNKLVDQFNQATPTVKVTVKTQPGAEYTQRLEAAASANQLPEIVALGYDQLAQLTEEQIIAPVGDFATTGGYGPDLYPKAIWDAAQWKGQTMGIPFDTHPMILFYNKKLFTDAGLDPASPPTDTASFETAIKTIKDKTKADGLQMVASGPGANFLVGLVWATLFYQGGGQWTNEDFSQATINSDAGIQASTYLAHLVKDLGVPKVESDAELNAFLQGKNAMMFNGPWQLTAAQDALKDDLGVALVPKFFGDGDWAGSHDLSVTASAQQDPDKKAGSYYFMDWFANHAVDWAASGQVPALNSVRAQLEGQTTGVLPYIAQIAPLADQVRFLPNIPGGGDILFVEHGAGEAGTLAINGSDPKDSLDKAAQYNTQVLQQNKERYGY
jgi:multiple sugar transport system substrate-binding protein